MWASNEKRVARTMLSRYLAGGLAGLGWAGWWMPAQTGTDQGCLLAACAVLCCACGLLLVLLLCFLAWGHTLGPAAGNRASVTPWWSCPLLEQASRGPLTAQSLRVDELVGLRPS